MTSASRPPGLALVLLVAAVVGFALGTWLGNASKSTQVVAVTSSETLSPRPATPVPLVSRTATPSPDPTERSAPTGESTETADIIFSIEGTKHEVTDSFNVKAGWQIQWQIDGDAIAVAVSGDPNLGVVIDEKGPSSGIAGIAEGGKFALNIVATGHWKITVIDGQEPTGS